MSYEKDGFCWFMMFEDVKINIVGLVNWSFQRSPPIASLLPRLHFLPTTQCRGFCATAKQCSKPLNGHGGKRWCGAAVLFLFFVSCSFGPSWTIMDLIVQNDKWISKWLLSIPIGSMYGIYMLTFGVYWWDLCYHILHTWILWDTILFIVPLLQVHWSTFFHHVGHLRSSASRLL
jgi:hypothetical protein